MLFFEQLARLLLVKRPALRGQEHRVHMLARAQRLVAQIERLGQHDLPAAAAVGRVVRLVVLVERVIADVGRADAHQPLVLRAADDALAHDRVDHLREQGHNVDPHSTSPSMLSI